MKTELALGFVSISDCDINDDVSYMDAGSWNSCHHIG